MKIYQVTVTPQTISDKNTLRKAVPLLIWLVVFFIALGLMCATENLIFFIDLIDAKPFISPHKCL